MEKNKEIEVSFVTDKQLWAELKEFCREKTKQSGERTLIKTEATNAIRYFLKDDKFESGFNKAVSVNNRIYKRYNTCLSEYKSLKIKYKTMKIGFILLAVSFVLSCTYQLLNYLGV